MFRKTILLFVLPFMATISLHANDPFFDDPFGDDIFKEMYQMQKDMDKIFERMQERMEQRSKLWNYPTRQSFLPGQRTRTESLFVDKGSYYEYDTQIPQSPDNQVDISIHDGVLHFKAKVDTTKKSKNQNMQMQQHYVSMIQRSETLPKDADPRSLKSEYKHGKLVLILDKKKRIEKPAVEVNKDQTTDEKSKLEKSENNATKVKVPHSSSHV